MLTAFLGAQWVLPTQQEAQNDKSPKKTEKKKELKKANKKKSVKKAKKDED